MWLCFLFQDSMHQICFLIVYNVAYVDTLRKFMLLAMLPGHCSPWERVGYSWVQGSGWPAWSSPERSGSWYLLESHCKACHRRGHNWGWSTDFEAPACQPALSRHWAAKASDPLHTWTENSSVIVKINNYFLLGFELQHNSNNDNNTIFKQ